jgi:hypothetical protein
VQQALGEVELLDLAVGKIVSLPDVRVAGAARVLIISVAIVVLSFR